MDTRCLVGASFETLKLRGPMPSDSGSLEIPLQSFQGFANLLINYAIN